MLVPVTVTESLRSIWQSGECGSTTPVRTANLRLPLRLDGFPVGAYLTDGRRLVQVERRTQDVGGGTVVEVEDCMTFELPISQAITSVAVSRCLRASSTDSPYRRE
jgi:hypothetical protein